MPVKGDYLSSAQAALDSANQFAKETTPQAAPSAPHESVGMGVLRKMLGVADLAALPALFLPGADVPAGAYLAARSGQSAVNNFRTGHPVKGALDAAMSVPMVGGAVRGARGMVAAAEDAARVAKETGAVRESVAMAKDLLENGFSHGAAGKIAQVPSKGKSSVTAIRHLSQLPDEEAGAARVAGTRVARQGRGDAMSAFQRQTPEVVHEAIPEAQAQPDNSEVTSLVDQSRAALSKIRRVPQGPDVSPSGAGPNSSGGGGPVADDPLEETLNRVHGEDGDWPDNSMLDRLSAASKSVLNHPATGLVDDAAMAGYKTLSGNGGNGTYHEVSPANITRSLPQDDLAAGDQQAVQRILFGGPQGVPGAPFPPRGGRMPLDKFSLNALINTIRTGG